MPNSLIDSASPYLLQHAHNPVEWLSWGKGGGRLSVFLTPAGAPFYGGTYSPPEPRHGLPSFRQVLEGVAEAWRTRRAQVLENGAALRAGIAGKGSLPSARAMAAGG